MVKVSAFVAVVFTAFNLLLLSLLISRTHPPHYKSFHNQRAVARMVPLSQQMGDKPNCRFDYETEWDALPVPACAHEGEAQSFLMIFIGESGSTAIQWATMRHSRVFELDEQEGASFDEMELIEDWRFTNVSKVDRIRHYFGQAAKAGKIPGFKFRPGHLEAIKEIVPMYKPRFIWNYRQNSLAKAIGDMRKKKTGKPPGGLTGNITWAGECEKNATCKFTIDIPELLGSLASNLHGEQSEFHTLEGIGSKCVLPVSYEEFNECPDRTFAQIQKFLGLPYEYHPPKYHKMSADFLCDSIENWDEICHTIMPCRDLRWQLNSHFKCKCNKLDFNKTRECPAILA